LKQQELGLEAFDFVTDRYHDHVYDGVGKVGPWVKQKRPRTKSLGAVGGKGDKNEEVTVTVKEDNKKMPQSQADTSDRRGRGYGDDRRREVSR
jgi:hypothetical protein